MIYENFVKSLAIFGNLWKTLETVQNCFFKIFEKSSQVFGNLQKFSENFRNGSKVFFRCFYDF